MRRAKSGGAYAARYAILTLRDAWEFSSRNDFFVSFSCAVGWTFPLTSVAREKSVCSPGAACHGPSSIFTSTDLIGVPSLRTTVSTLYWLPVFVTRAMNDFRFMCVTAVSMYFICPSIISPRTVRYHRAWYLPRYASSWMWICESHFTLATPYQPGVSRRSGAP